MCENMSARPPHKQHRQADPSSSPEDALQKCIAKRTIAQLPSQLAHALTSCHAMQCKPCMPDSGSTLLEATACSPRPTHQWLLEVPSLLKLEGSCSNGSSYCCSCCRHLTPCHCVSDLLHHLCFLLGGAAAILTHQRTAALAEPDKHA